MVRSCWCVLDVDDFVFVGVFGLIYVVIGVMDGCYGWFVFVDFGYVGREGDE